MKQWSIIIILIILVIASFIYFNLPKLKLSNQLPIKETKNNMKIESPAFKNDATIPVKYTCGGQNINPAFNFSDVPEGTESLALIMDDPDAPSGTFVHWVLWNINPQTKEISENSKPPEAVAGATSRGKSGYVGPCPPSGTHHYFFKLYALDIILNLSSQADKTALEKAMEGHILDKAELIGLYSRQN